MSAVPKQPARLEPMREADLAAVLAVERTIYRHPWTRGNFADSLHAGYQCWSCWNGRELIGYFVLLVAAGEAHLLNLSVAEAYQGRGHGGALLSEIVRIARAQGAHHVFLEVRPSNRAAQALYTRFGFRRIAMRSGYYPDGEGREDAFILKLAL